MNIIGIKPNISQAAGLRIQSRRRFGSSFKIELKQEQIATERLFGAKCLTWGPIYYQIRLVPIILSRKGVNLHKFKMAAKLNFGVLYLHTYCF